MLKISHSRIKTWRRCKKAHDYKYNQRLRRKAPALPLLRGTIIGECLDALTEKKANFEKVLEKYEAQYRRLFREEREMYGDLIGDIRTIISGYVKHWKDDGLKYLSVEHELMIELAPGAVFVGYLDKAARDRQNRLWIMDHKSHRVIPGDDQRAADIQSVFYNWGWNEMNPDDPSDGFIWDYLRTKPPAIPEQLKNGGLSQRVNMDTTYDTYFAEIVRLGLDPGDYAETLERLAKEPNSFYKRVFMPNPPAALVKQVVDDMKVELILIKNLGQDLTTRTLTRDCPQCEFFNLCQAELRGQAADIIRKREYYAKEDPKEGERLD